MSIDTDISASEDLFGKVVSDLQSGITVGADGAVTGELKYISDYTGFDEGNPAMQVGNYLALHCTTNVAGATISVKITNPKTLDDDGIFVGRIADKDTQTITITASAEGYQTTTKVLTLDGLTCESASAQEE